MASRGITRTLLILSLLSPALAAGAEGAYVLSSPPRESAAKAAEVYQPIADFLATVTGKPFVYRYPDNWLAYEEGIRKDSYDLVFDGPAFISWRMRQFGHTPLVRVPGELSFLLFAKKDNAQIADLKDLGGHAICAFPPPNLATLVVMYQFDNPAREPTIVEVPSFRAAYDGVVSGKCDGGILQAKLYETFDKDQATKVLFRSKPVANQAFTASRRISPQMRQKITEGLLSKGGEAATAKLREEFKGQHFVAAKPEDYTDDYKLLRDVWGF